MSHTGEVVQYATTPPWKGGKGRAETKINQTEGGKEDVHDNENETNGDGLRSERSLRAHFLAEK